MANTQKKPIQYSQEQLSQLEESEKRYRALLSATADVIYTMNADWSVMRMLHGKGFLADTSEPINDWINKYIHPNDQEQVLQVINDAIKNKSIFELEHQVLLPDRSLGWTFSRAVPIIDEAGNIIEWFGAANDITSRKQTEASLENTKKDLEKSQQLYNAITSSTPDLIYSIDLNYRFTFANTALLEMWGTTEKEAMGKGLLQLGYEPWHAEMHEREIDEVVATKKSIRGEVSFPHARLGKRVYDYIFAPVFSQNGEVTAIAGTTRDISEIRIMQEALKQSEEQFRLLTQSLPQLVWTTQADGYADFFNQGWYDYTGSTPENSCGDGWTNYIHPQHREMLFVNWQHSLATGTPINFEFLLRNAEGIYNWFYVLGNPIKDENNTIRRWVGALTNIQEQKLQKEKLEQLVGERTKELQRSNEDLLQFAHVASHDLKEPLRKIKTFSNFLKSELNGQLSEKTELYFQKIYSATNRMDTMIEGVLNYSRLTNLQESFQQVNLNEIINNIEGDLELLIQQKHAVIEHNELGYLYGSPVLLNQLFYNLVYNSLKFSRSDVNPIISIQSNQEIKNEKLFTVIRIKDNGIGFDQEYAEDIFNTFTRLNPKSAYEGTGLGLALCKKIAERHHGTVTAIGKENEGAEFIVRLPVKQ